jgi:ribosomal protein S12 methylthiotransferase accessory factor
MRLQSSTNGWATGSSLEDAVLQGLYEVIERDSWTIWLTLVEGRGVWPPRINIDYVQDWEWFHETLERMEEEALKVVLFDVTTDTSIPVVWALIYDLSDNPAGLFNGYGCAATQTGAIQRAVLEAIQSRACYIAGARDDLLRRSFMLMKHFDQPLAYEALMMQIPTTVHFDYSAPESLTAKQELARTLDILEQYGFTEFYVRNADHPYPNLYVAKVIAPCLEQYRCGYWQPTKRLFDFIARYANR